MDYKKKYLKYKTKYLSYDSLFNRIMLKMNLEKDIKKISIVDNIKFMLNIEQVIKDMKKNEYIATQTEKYIINLNSSENALIMRKISLNYYNNLLLDLYFIIGNEYSLETIHFDKIYENINIIKLIEIDIINKLDNMIADEKLFNFYNIDMIRKWEKIIINIPVDKQAYFKLSQLDNMDKEIIWEKYLIIWEKFMESCLIVKQHLKKIINFYSTKQYNEIIGCYNIDVKLYEYCLESHLGLKLDILKLEKWALKELDNLVFDMKQLLKKMHPEININDSHIDLIKKYGVNQKYESKEEFINNHMKSIEKYKKIYIDMLNFKNYNDLKLIVFDNKHLSGGYYFDNKFYLNCSNWNSAYKYSTESLVLHETYPGHHLQIHTIKYKQTKNSLLYSYFNNIVNGFVEGWGLFAEKLGYEQSLWDKIGCIEYDILRTLRVIIDIRIHYKGIKYEENYNFMKQYSSLPDDSIKSEIYRYMCMSGQAVCYKVGCEIFKIIFKKNKIERNELCKKIINDGCSTLSDLLNKYNIDKNELFN